MFISTVWTAKTNSEYGWDCSSEDGPRKQLQTSAEPKQTSSQNQHQLSWAGNTFCMLHFPVQVTLSPGYTFLSRKHFLQTSLSLAGNTFYRLHFMAKSLCNSCSYDSLTNCFIGGGVGCTILVMKVSCAYQVYNVPYC